MDNTNFGQGQTPARTGAVMGQNPKGATPKKKGMLALILLVAASAAVGGFYLFSGETNTPPALEPKAKATQGFIKDAKLGFAVATKEDQECFKNVSKKAKADGQEATVLNSTATNEGQHYLFWNGDTSTKATFKDVGCNTDPLKTRMLFMAKWDAANNYFVTSPHDYYLKEKDGKILTKVVEAENWNTVPIVQSGGFIFASPGSTESYGFSDGRTFAKAPYGICDAAAPKANGWNLFASHTKDTKELFKLCKDGEIKEFYAQTSVDPVKFKKVESDTTLKYSMVWVFKSDAVKDAEEKPKEEEKPEDNVYTLDTDKKTLTVKYGDKSVVQYKLAEEKLPQGTKLSYKLSEKDKNVMIVQNDGIVDRKVGSLSFDEKQKLVSTLEKDFAESYKVGYDKTTKTVILTYLKEPAPKKNEYSLSDDQVTLNVEMSDGKKGSFRLVEKSLGENLRAIFTLENEDGKTKPVNVIEYNTTDQKEIKIGTVAFDDKKQLVVNVLPEMKDKYSITMDPKKPEEIVVTDIVLGAPKIAYVLDDFKESVIVTFKDEKKNAYKLEGKDLLLETTLELTVDKTNNLLISEKKGGKLVTVATITFDTAVEVPDETKREAKVELVEAYKTLYKVAYDKTQNIITLTNIKAAAADHTYTVDKDKNTLTVKFADGKTATETYKLGFESLPEKSIGFYTITSENKMQAVVSDITDIAQPKSTKVAEVSFDKTNKPVVKLEEGMDGKYEVRLDEAAKTITTKAKQTKVANVLAAPKAPTISATVIDGAFVNLVITESQEAGGVAADSYNIWVSNREGVYGDITANITKADYEFLSKAPGGYIFDLREEDSKIKVKVTAVNAVGVESTPVEIEVKTEVKSITI